MTAKPDPFGAALLDAYAGGSGRHAIEVRELVEQTPWRLESAVGSPNYLAALARR